MPDDASLLTLPHHELSVPLAWIDDNRHMNAAYYTVAIQQAAIEAHNQWGYGEAFRRETNESNFVYNTQVIYLRELLLGDRIGVTTVLRELDGKRMRLLMEIRNLEKDYLAAVVQYLVIHVKLGPPPRAASIPPEVLARLTQVQKDHAGYPLPPEAAPLLAVPLKPRQEGERCHE